jgi:hypothetical protein
MPTPRAVRPRSSPQTKPRTPKKKSPKKKKVHPTVQSVYAKFRRAFGPNPRCVPDEATTSVRLRKTPRGDAEKCLGSVRLGQNGTHLYMAQRTMKKNPRIKFSTTPTGRGYHLAFKWTKLYDDRTKKAFKVLSASSGKYLA